MPPYASAQDDSQVAFDVSNADDHDLTLLKTIEVKSSTNAVISDELSSFTLPVIENRSIGLPVIENQDSDEETKEEEGNRQVSEPSKPSIMERLLDFNLCTVKISNPQSALFKIRVCSECGNRVHKYRNGGYKKELQQTKPETAVTDTDDESCEDQEAVKTKVYFHSDCLQKHNDRIVHKETSGFGLVLEELVKVVEARKKAEEEAAAAAAAAASAEPALESPADVTRRQKKPGFFKRTKKALKIFSFGGCRGKKDSTDKSAFRGAEV